MKKYCFITFIIIVTTISFFSCQGYDEGPEFSLLTPEMRIKGSWNQTELYINDELQDGTLKVEFTLNSDGTGTRTTSLGSTSTTDEIDWQFNDEKTILMTKKTDAEEFDEATILRLTNKEMWIVDDAGIWGMWEFRYEKI